MAQGFDQGSNRCRCGQALLCRRLDRCARRPRGRPAMVECLRRIVSHAGGSRACAPDHAEQSGYSQQSGRTLGNKQQADACCRYNSGHDFRSSNSRNRGWIQGVHENCKQAWRRRIVRGHAVRRGRPVRKSMRGSRPRSDSLNVRGGRSPLSSLFESRDHPVFPEVKSGARPIQWTNLHTVRSFDQCSNSYSAKREQKPLRKPPPADHASQISEQLPR
jgi:hypothetical protein